ncbi:LIC_13241 domain-containing protein [Leptospira semungkisensis]|uniref:LIC_13241 domain-containing protein n=1 Tax=Leptospira semungkisensis TaxID=2484985 RepID=UPI003CCC80DD
MSESDWPKTFEFVWKSEQYKLVFSGLGSVTLIPSSDPWGRKGQPIFYLNLSEEDPNQWSDLSGNTYKGPDEIQEVIHSSIGIYKKALAGE